MLTDIKQNTVKRKIKYDNRRFHHTFAQQNNLKSSYYKYDKGHEVEKVEMLICYYSQ